MTKLKKNTSLSLLVDLSMYFDFLERMYMYQSLSLSLSIYICKNGLDPGIQERMFHQVKNLFMRDRKCAKYRTKAGAHDKMGFKCIHCPVPCADPEGGISQQYWTGSPEILKTTKPAFNHLGHHRQASETPFKGVSLAGR